MQVMRPLDVAMAALLLFASPALAGSCETSIDDLQARVDAEIEKQPVEARKPQCNSQLSTHTAIDSGGRRTGGQKIQRCVGTS